VAYEWHFKGGIFQHTCKYEFSTKSIGSLWSLYIGYSSGNGNVPPLKHRLWVTGFHIPLLETLSTNLTSYIHEFEDKSLLLVVTENTKIEAKNVEDYRDFVWNVIRNVFAHKVWVNITLRHRKRTNMSSGLFYISFRAAGASSYFRYNICVYSNTNRILPASGMPNSQYQTDSIRRQNL
jgi:hypothetical protein